MRPAPEASRVNPQHDTVDGPIWRGQAADSDIIVASVKAYVLALNRMIGAVGQTPGRRATRPKDTTHVLEAN